MMKTTSCHLSRLLPLQPAFVQFSLFSRQLFTCLLIDAHTHTRVDILRIYIEKYCIDNDNNKYYNSINSTTINL